MATLKIDRGTTYTINYQYLRNGIPTSLVGHTVRFTMKAAEYDSDATDTTAIVKKDVTTGTAEGLAEIVIDPIDTATATPGKYFYDIRLETPTNEIFKVDEGKVTLDASPTNRT